MEEENSITFKYNEEKRLYEMVSKSGNPLDDEIDKFIAEHQHKDMVLLTDADYTALRKQRTLINNKIKELQKTRKQVVGILTGDLTMTSIRLEKKLSAVSNEMTERLKTQVVEEEKQETKTYKLIVKGTDKNALSLVKKLALELELEIKEEEE